MTMNNVFFYHKSVIFQWQFCLSQNQSKHKAWLTASISNIWYETNNNTKRTIFMPIDIFISKDEIPHLKCKNNLFWTSLHYKPDEESYLKWECQSNHGITSNIAYFHVKRRANASNRGRSSSYIRPNSGSMHI